MLHLGASGEFQEVVDVKLRHTHPRVQKQRAAAANLAAAVAASSTSAAASDEDPSSTAEELTLPLTTPSSASTDSSSVSVGTRGGMQDAADVSSSISSKGIQVVQVLPWSDVSSLEPAAAGGQQELLLELEDVSINTPDGGLALVQHLSLKVIPKQSAPLTCSICHAMVPTTCWHTPCFWR